MDGMRELRELRVRVGSHGGVVDSCLWRHLREVPRGKVQLVRWVSALHAPLCSFEGFHTQPVDAFLVSFLVPVFSSIVCRPLLRTEPMERHPCGEAVKGCLACLTLLLLLLLHIATAPTRHAPCTA